MTALPTGWAVAPLTDIITIYDSKRIPLNKAHRAAMPGSIPYYGANGLVDHVRDYIFDGDYVLLAEDGGYFDEPARGVAYEVLGRFWVNNHAHILKPADGIQTRFLRHLLNATDWMPYVSGTTRLKLPQAGMQRAMVWVPPLAEQRRIVAKVDGLFASSYRARHELDRVPKLAEHYRQAILTNAFSSDLTAHWPMRTVQQVVDEAMIGLVRSTAAQSDSSGTPYMRMNHYDLNGNWNDEKLTRVETSPEELERYKLHEGDILFNTRNSYELVGKVAIWPKGRPGYVYNNNLLRLRFSQSIEPRFAALYMMSPPFRDYLQTVKSATTSVCAIYQRSLMAAAFPLPSADQQTAVVKAIDSAFAWLDKLLSEHRRANHLLPKLDQAILTKAFRGQLVPQDPDDEPADKLLERLGAERAQRPQRRGRTGRRKRANHRQ